MPYYLRLRIGDLWGVPWKWSSNKANPPNREIFRPLSDLDWGDREKVATATIDGVRVNSSNGDV
jgi:hypothetical protein